VSPRKKLIEVALPLEAINSGSKPETENPFLKGHPRAVHNWWARTPLSVARAVLFAQLIDDPGHGLPPDVAARAREKVLDLVARLATWEATMDEAVLEEARRAIRLQFGGDPPEFWDMFAGRASIPLEAQRLGLKVTSSDLNPVAVTIQRALLEFPAKLSGHAPVHPGTPDIVGQNEWPGTTGLAEDIRWYGEWIRREAADRLAHLYPRVDNGKEVIAWLWARMVPSPNPVCNGALVPLVRSFFLAKSRGKVWVEPVIDKKNNTVTFEVRHGNGAPSVTGTVSRRGGKCLLSDTPMPFAYIREQGKAGRMTSRLMAIVAQGPRGRIYLPPLEDHAVAAAAATPEWKPDCVMPVHHRDFKPPQYGLGNMGDLFTGRQLVALITLCELIEDVRAKVLSRSKEDHEYADALAVYLACALSRMTDYHCSLCTWNSTNENVSHLFQRQVIPMAWDFCEANPVSGKLSYAVAAHWVADSLANLPRGQLPARVLQLDARGDGPSFSHSPVISTDPPYYDNIDYADLSDFFYTWLRRVLRRVDTRTFSTLLTPKEPELVASALRHGTPEAADRHFREGFSRVFSLLRKRSHVDVPLTVYYAFKQDEDANADAETGGQASTGWETMLEGMMDAGFAVTATWPVRTTKKARSIARDANALASAIVIVARRRPAHARLATRREFTSALRRELPDALLAMMEANVAPVDLAQASIGPGMAVFSRYAKVLEANGSPMSVRTALQIINQELDAHLSAQEGDLDRDTRFCIAWFEQYGLGEGPFGEADVLARAKNTAVGGLVEAGVLASSRGKVRLLRREELPSDWDPVEDRRLTTWEAVQQLIRRLEDGGEDAAAALAARLGSWAADAHALAYRLYNICDRKGWAEEARGYNTLIVSWPSIQEKVAQVRPSEQQPLDIE